MSKKLYEENNIQDIANAIRSKNGTQNAYTVAQMGNAIRAIKTQPDLETLTATENKTYWPSANKDGFSEVTVNVPSSATLYPVFTRMQGYIDAANGVIAQLSSRPYYKYDATPACAGYFYDGEYTHLILVSITPEGCWYQCDQGDVHTSTEIISHNRHLYVTIPNLSVILKRISSDGPAYKLSDDILTVSEAQQLLVDNANGIETWLVDHNGVYEVPEGYDGFKSFSVNVPAQDLPNASGVSF